MSLKFICASIFFGSIFCSSISFRPEKNIVLEVCELVRLIMTKPSMNIDTINERFSQLQDVSAKFKNLYSAQRGSEQFLIDDLKWIENALVYKNIVIYSFPKEAITCKVLKTRPTTIDGLEAALTEMTSVLSFRRIRQHISLIPNLEIS